MEQILNNIQLHFKITEIIKQRNNLTFVTIQKEQVIPLLTLLQDQEGFSHFVLLTAVDWIEEGEFQLTYILNAPWKKVDLGIRTQIGRDDPEMESAHQLWEQVATYQRELKEMYGIHFPGSPRLDEEFFLEGWEDIPPMRREFDSKKYSEQTYFPRPGSKGYDPREYMKQKLYSDDYEEEQDGQQEK
ncbi:MAG: NADH-quinone oxidoreductase subunit C [Bacteroidota bacterium]